VSRPILLVGDIHLGRRPTGLEKALEVLGLEPHRLSAAAAWGATVRWAVDRRARAVILAGDVVEGLQDRFEAYAHLQRGASKLADAGIPLFAVVGNHDVEALPRLADRVPEVTLVGRGGRWRIVPIPEASGEAPVDLVGWSFPSDVVREDPTTGPSFDTALNQRRPGARLIGVVHGDLDAPSSRYAPLSRHRLEGSPADAWFLGHIHVPSSLHGPRPLGYLGSLAALDPGETGVHGPWELEIDEELHLRQVPLSPVRFETVELKLAGPQAADADALLAHAGREIRHRLGPSLETGSGHLQLLAVRVILGGRIGGRSGLDDLLQRSPEERIFPGEDPPLVITRIIDRTAPAIDLAELAGAPTPAGELARTILALEHDPPADLLRKAEDAIAPWTDARWTGAEIPEPPPVRELLLAAARRALWALLEHRSEASG